MYLHAHTHLHLYLFLSLYSFKTMSSSWYIQFWSLAEFVLVIFFLFFNSLPKSQKLGPCFLAYTWSIYLNVTKAHVPWHWTQVGALHPAALLHACFPHPAPPLHAGLPCVRTATPRRAALWLPWERPLSACPAHLAQTLTSSSKLFLGDVLLAPFGLLYPVVGKRNSNGP